MNDYVCVIGGVNIDISGTPYSILNPNDSNPGKVTTSMGGVARNIAENLSRIGVSVEFISVFGDDSYAKEIESSCKELNISLQYSEEIENKRTSIYLCINDDSGEMQLAISNMDIYKYLTPEFLSKRLDIINNSRACVLDTNIPKDSIEYLVDNVKVPIFIDTVSIKKTEKLMDCLYNVYSLKPNIREAEILSGTKINGKDDLSNAANIILNKGVKKLYISLGADGVYYNDGINEGILPSITDEIINTTGAGDSFLAGVIWASLNGYDIKECAKAGLSASYICVKSYRTVSEDMSEENIKKLTESKWR
jgi:pseudouridine kinase